MRPEIREYNMDWMLSSIMMAASKTADGSEKEYQRLLEYIPYFSGILNPIKKEGKPGITFLKMFSDYLENIVTAHDMGKKVAMTTFCFSPSILYSLGIVPVTLEVLSTFATLMWKRGTADYLDFCMELGFTETASNSR